MPLLLPALAAAAALATPGMAQSDLPGLVTAEEYPAEALAEGKSAAATIAIRVDPKGHPIGCRVAAVVGDAALADAICQIAMRKRYFAARLLDGAPAHAQVTTTVRLWVPGSPDAEKVAAVQPGPDYDVRVAPAADTPPLTDVRMVLQVSRKGAVTQCGAKDESQADLARAICKARTIFRTGPLQDERGQPVPYVTEATVRIHAGA